MAILSLSEYTVESDAANIPGSVENRCALMLPDQEVYDERIKGAAIGSTAETGTVSTIFAEYGNSNIAFILTSDNSVEDLGETIKRLLDFSYTFETLDLMPFVQIMASNLFCSSGATKISGFDAARNEPLLFSAYPGFKEGFDPKKLYLDFEPDSLNQLIYSGKPTVLAILSYNERALSEVELAPINIITNTPKPEATPEPAEESDALLTTPAPETSSGIMDRFGWLVWSAAAAGLSAAVVIIGRFIRKRMR
jgi:hypothetical protein